MMNHGWEVTMELYTDKLNSAIQKVFQEMNSLNDKEFSAVIEEYKNDELTDALSIATYEYDEGMLYEVEAEFVQESADNESDVTCPWTVFKEEMYLDIQGIWEAGEIVISAPLIDLDYLTIAPADMDWIVEVDCNSIPIEDDREVRVQKWNYESTDTIAKLAESNFDSPDDYSPYSIAA